MNDITVYYDLLFLKVILNNEDQERITRYALENLDQTSAELRTNFIRKIQKYVRVKGFRPGHVPHKPVSKILTPVVESAFNNAEMLSSIVQVWVDTQTELRAQVVDFLTSEDIPVEETCLLDKGFVNYWIVDELKVCVEGFSTEHYENHISDVLLMFCCLTCRAPVTKEILDEIRQQQGDIMTKSEIDTSKFEGQLWGKLLKEINSLPPNSPDWENVTDFIDVLKEIIQNRASVLSVGIRHLQEDIEALTRDLTETLDYFGMSKVYQWNASLCNINDVDELTKKVEEFKEKLVEYQTLYQQTAPSFKEERQRRITLEQVETDALSLYESLNSILFLTQEFVHEDTLEERDQVSEPADDKTEESKGDASIFDLAGEKMATDEASKNEVVFEEVAVIDTKNEQILQEIFVTTNQELESEEIVGGSKFGTPEDEPIVKLTGQEEVIEEVIVDNVEVAFTPEISVPPMISVELSAPPQQTSREAALNLLEQENEERWYSLLWSLIAEGDLAGAYWLSRSLTTQQITSPIPSWLLEAMVGSSLLTSESDSFVLDLLRIADNQLPEIDGYQGLLGLGVALRPSLIAPYSGLIGWLRTPKSFPDLNDFVQSITRFAGLDITLRPEDVLGVSGAQQREAQILDAVRAAERWLETASSRHLMLKRTSDIWQYLVKPGGYLRNLMSPVAMDDRNNIDLVREKLRAWDWEVEDQIDRADKEIHKLRTKTLYGRPRDQLRLDFLEACQIARNWCDLVSHENKIALRGNWVFEQIEKLQESLLASLPRVSRVIVEGTKPEVPAPINASFQFYKYSLTQLLSVLQIRTDGYLDPGVFPSDWNWLTYGAVNLSEVLNKRLLMFPEIELSNQLEPLPESIIAISYSIRDSILAKRSLLDAYQAWIEKQDYRFVDIIGETLRENTDITELTNRYHEAKEGSRLALKDNIVHAENLIEQAVVDGIIAEERSEFSSLVESIDPAQVLNFSAHYKQLENVCESLQNARQARLDELREGWTKIESNLELYENDTEKRNQIEELVSTALEKQDTRLLEEILARLTEIIDSGGKFDESWFLYPKIRDELADFTDAMPKIEEWLKVNDNNLKFIANDFRNGKTVGNIKFAEISPKRREEAFDAVLVWRQLKSSGSGGRYNSELISKVLEYLGFTSAAHNQNPIEVAKTGKDWLYIQANVSASDLAKPIPQFGSLTKNNYHIICLWERPGPETISARLRELRLKLDSVIVFYLGRLTLRQRYELIRISAEQELALAVLDEILLLNLAQERDTRLPAFMKCSLPFSSVNPYTPFQAGDVPPEMFFGRDAMARELLRSHGSSLVYGGRQLGKSALLRRVERDFHNPSREHYAYLEDIKLIGDPLAGQPKEIIWRRMRDALKELNLISPRVVTDSPDDIERYIRDAMSQNPSRRVILLFDEADNFLDADAKGNFQITERLRDLMFDTQRRFKVVFAGLHNVQRFQGIANQPLAHFGVPLCVGPLEPDAAYQLVQKPLEYLGCRFADESAPLRILSYTNYHPGLIQLFCQVLLTTIRSRSKSSYPPYQINQSDIEAVYRLVRDRIRERFDWTLALDMRYQAIAWSLIVDQMAMKDSYALAYPPGEILKLMREWWPQGFNNIATEELRSLMDEMVGLGVLVRSSMGQYRLRSPNLVRLMGTEADIEQQLLELVGKKPPETFEADYHHAPLDERAVRYSVFTYSQERSLNAKRFGVDLVFCSEALGWSKLLDSIQKFIPLEDPLPQGSFTEIPLYVMNGEQLKEHLDKHLRTYSDLDVSINYYRPTQTNPDELVSLVEGGLDFCRRRQYKKKILRLVFLLDPLATWAWHSIAPIVRKKLEDNCDAVISPNKWNTIGIRQRLAQRDMMHTPKICEEVVRVTGGWPFLLDILLDRCGSKDDPRPFAEIIAAEIIDSKSQLNSDFYEALGIKDLDKASVILKYLFGGEQIPLDYVNPEFIGEEYRLSEDDCSSSLDFLKRLKLIDQTSELILVDPIVRSVFTNR